MAITRTSRTRLFDRVIRVDRRHLNRDNMGGVYADYATIIPRYHVRIVPDVHRRREREEPGEILANPSEWRGFGNPTHNGITIRIGDRFIDEKNNQCYDVRGVWRPKGQTGYSLLNQFDLRIVEDCPQMAVAVPTGSDLVSGAQQTHFIMRHFGQDELLGWESLPYFDGFVYNLQRDDLDDIATVSAAIAAGKRWWRYYNVQSYPFNAAEFGGLTPPLATWFNWLRDNLQFSGTASHRRMRVGDLVALFPGFESPLGQSHELIPWSIVSSVERQAAVDQMVGLAISPGGITLPSAGVFLDQCWLKIHDFQVTTDPFDFSGHGDTKESSPGLFALLFAAAEAAFGAGDWIAHTTATSAMYAEFDGALEPTGKYAIKNGEHREQNGTTIPKPWYFENAWNSPIDLGATQAERWASAKAGFATDSRNVLSILCSSSASNSTVGVPEALDHWQATGGWIAFTAQDDPGQPGSNNAEVAYAEAAARLAALGFGN